MSESCKTCRYWLAPVPLGDRGLGVCRRMPPQPMASRSDGGSIVTFSSFAESAPDAWCGEHRPTAEELSRRQVEFQRERAAAMQRGGWDPFPEEKPYDP